MGPGDDRRARRVRHSESNPGSVAIEGVVELRPGLRSKEMHEAFGGLSSERQDHVARAHPKNPLQLGATLWYFRQENRVTSPPAWVQNLILPPLAALAKVFGVRPCSTAGTAASQPQNRRRCREPAHPASPILTVYLVAWRGTPNASSPASAWSPTGTEPLAGALADARPRPAVRTGQIREVGRLAS